LKFGRNERLRRTSAFRPPGCDGSPENDGCRGGARRGRTDTGKKIRPGRRRDLLGKFCGGRFFPANEFWEVACFPAHELFFCF
jgi:hypothetical protein